VRDKLRAVRDSPFDKPAENEVVAENAKCKMFKCGIKKVNAGFAILQAHGKQG